jgi:hypothetical protein
MPSKYQPRTGHTRTSHEKRTHERNADTNESTHGRKGDTAIHTSTYRSCARPIYLPRALLMLRDSETPLSSHTRGPDPTRAPLDYATHPHTQAGRAHAYLIRHPHAAMTNHRPSAQDAGGRTRPSARPAPCPTRPPRVPVGAGVPLVPRAPEPPASKKTSQSASLTASPPSTGPISTWLGLVMGLAATTTLAG